MVLKHSESPGAIVSVEYDEPLTGSEYIKCVDARKVPFVPDQLSAFIKNIENEKSTRTKFVCTALLLTALHKERKFLKRQKIAERKNENAEKIMKSPKKKIDYFSYVHPELRKSNSKSILTAIAWFGLSTRGHIIRSSVMQFIAQGGECTYEKLAKLTTNRDVKAFLGSQKLPPMSEGSRLGLIRSLLLVAELCTDYGSSALAKEIDFNLYLIECDSLQYDKLEVYIPLIRYYLDRVLPYFQRRFMQNSIEAAFTNQTVQTPGTSSPHHAVIKNIITAVREALKSEEELNNLSNGTTLKRKPMRAMKQLSESGSNSNVTTNNLKRKREKPDVFDDNLIYQVFMAPPRTNANMVSTRIINGGISYFVTVCDSTIYDVLGKDGRLLDDLSWKERLDSLALPKSIAITEMSGADLNEYIKFGKNCDILYSWMDNGKTNRASYTCTNKKPRKSKATQATQEFVAENENDDEQYEENVDE